MDQKTLADQVIAELERIQNVEPKNAKAVEAVAHTMTRDSASIPSLAEMNRRTDAWKAIANLALKIEQGTASDPDWSWALEKAQSWRRHL